MTKKFFLLLVLSIFLIPSFSFAWSQNQTFFVDPNYDVSGRTQISTQLIKTTNQFYFYVDSDWYEHFSDKNQLASVLYSLATEFEYQIYPNLTNLLGFEDTPGIDNDKRVIIVLEPLQNNYAGYIRSGDGLPLKLNPTSNQGQIIFLNANLITKSPLNFLEYELGHEFGHLIVLKQKPQAETWFQELIAEFAGQISSSDASEITKKRAQSFLYTIEVNLLDWKNTEKDYAKVYLLALYLREQFGPSFFQEVLRDPNNGVLAFDAVLKKRGLSFEEVYLNWLITNLYNNCENNLKYCYQDLNLKNFSVVPYSYYLPMQQKSLLSVTDSLSGFTAKWQKLNGGLGTVELKFTLPEATPIGKIPYLLEDKTGKKTLGFLDFSSSNMQTLYASNMGSQNVAIYFIPFLGLEGKIGQMYYYSWEATNLDSSNQTEKEMIQALEQKVAALQQQLADLKLQLAYLQTQKGNLQCTGFSADLAYGMTSPEVKCLQQFLANLGPEIYPEKLVTGYFGPLTQAAVKRYQALKGIVATGYFGPLTRAQANQEM